MSFVGALVGLSTAVDGFVQSRIASMTVAASSPHQTG